MVSNGATSADVDAALHSIFEANRLLREVGEKLAARAGQTHSRRMVLRTAADGRSVADIARSLGLQRQGVQRIADELVRDGLAAYVENPRHKRAKLLAVTEPGSLALSSMEQAYQAWIESVRTKTRDVDWGTAARSLDLLVGVLRDMR